MSAELVLSDETLMAMTRGANSAGFLRFYSSP
jgi:hypothetical protein